MTAFRSDLIGLCDHLNSKKHVIWDWNGTLLNDVDHIEISGIEKKDTILIGDTIHDLEVGQALGIEVILLSHGHQCAKRLKSKHDKVIEVGAAYE